MSNERLIEEQLIRQSQLKLLRKCAGVARKRGDRVVLAQGGGKTRFLWFKCEKPQLRVKVA